MRRYITGFQKGVKHQLMRDLVLTLISSRSYKPTQPPLVSLSPVISPPISLTKSAISATHDLCPSARETQSAGSRSSSLHSTSASQTAPQYPCFALQSMASYARRLHSLMS